MVVKGGTGGGGGGGGRGYDTHCKTDDGRDSRGNSIENALKVPESRYVCTA